RPHDRFSRNIAASAGAVFDNELLPQPLRQPLRNQPSDDVVCAAWGITDEQGTGRVGESRTPARQESPGVPTATPTNFRNRRRVGAISSLRLTRSEPTGSLRYVNPIKRKASSARLR